MMRIAIGIKGITPLLMNRFSDEAAERASNGSGGGAGAPDRGSPREVAEGKLYHDLSGKICVPTPNILRCFVDGGVFHKIGKSQVTTKEKSLLYACLSIDAVTAELTHKGPWCVDTRPIVIPATKGRILAHRPRFDEWSTEVEVELDESLVNSRLLRLIIDDAGKRVGLGDFRPARKGPYGKFVVVKWIEKVLKPPKIAVEIREVA